MSNSSTSSNFPFVKTNALSDTSVHNELSSSIVPISKIVINNIENNNDNVSSIFAPFTDSVNSDTFKVTNNTKTNCDNVFMKMNYKN